MENAIDHASQLLHLHHHPHQFKVKKKRLLSLETYLSFLHNHDHHLHQLTVDHLNQIISIHGFKKLMRGGRKAIEESLEKLSLRAPARSTLNDNISSKTFVSLEETIRDLVALNWQECSITSIRSIRSVKDLDPPASEKARTKKARKMVSVTSLAATTTTTTSSSCSSEIGSGDGDQSNKSKSSSGSGTSNVKTTNKKRSVKRNMRLTL